MTEQREPERPRPRRAVLALPNGFTLASLFFGIFAIVTAARGDHARAAWYILFAGIADALDGRIARATRSASRFGEELDSLVDAISFGLAPGMLMFFVIPLDGMEWVFVFLFCACAVIRLARFNVMQAGRKKEYFIGLPSPMAGGTLAAYYWFSKTPLYSQFLTDLPWQFILKFLMLILGGLMISNVPYPVWPTFSLRTIRGAVGLTAFIAMLLGLVFLPQEFFFPVGVAYVLWGIGRAVVLGLLERGDDDSDDDQDDQDDQPDSHDPDVVPLNSQPRQTRSLKGRPGRPPEFHPE